MISVCSSEFDKSTGKDIVKCNNKKLSLVKYFPTEELGGLRIFLFQIEI